MKKLAISTLGLCMSCIMLVGCGCMDSSKDVPTLPTNGENSRPTYATEAPTTPPTTMPTTAATEAPTQNTQGNQDGTSDTTAPIAGPMDDILGGSTDDATDATVAGRNRGIVTPRG